MGAFERFPAHSAQLHSRSFSSRQASSLTIAPPPRRSEIPMKSSSVMSFSWAEGWRESTQTARFYRLPQAFASLKWLSLCICLHRRKFPVWKPLGRLMFTHFCPLAFIHMEEEEWCPAMLNLLYCIFCIFFIKKSPKTAKICLYRCPVCHLNRSIWNRHIQPCLTKLSESAIVEGPHNWSFWGTIQRDGRQSH